MTDYNALDNRTAVSLKGGSSKLILTRIQTIRGSSLCRITDFWMDILPCLFFPVPSGKCRDNISK